jgi:hypothetical protein
MILDMALLKFLLVLALAEPARPAEPIAWSFDTRG